MGVDQRRFQSRIGLGNMLVQSLLVGAVALLPSIVSAAPVEALGSKHTVFLARCAPTDCPIGLCDPDDCMYPYFSAVLLLMIFV